MASVTFVNMDFQGPTIGGFISLLWKIVFINLFLN